MRALVILLLASLAGCATGSSMNERAGDGGVRADGAVSIDAFVAPVDAHAPPLDGVAPMLDAATPPRDADSPPSDGGACPSGRTRCGDQCVDLMTTLAHCGACDRTCDVPSGGETCLGGTCFVGTCDPGRGDCNATASDGCETECASGSACTTSCGTTGSRSCASICAPTCTPPAEACNARDDDCDGACESGLTGCRRSVHRARRNAGGHFYTNDRAEADGPAFTVESYDYFMTYDASLPGLVQLHRCLLASGTYFYTTDGGCEGAAGATYQGSLGWMAPSTLCGSTPLYRLYGGTAGHFYTIDAAERSSAISSGYADEGVIGHVWRGF